MQINYLATGFEDIKNSIRESFQASTNEKFRQYPFSSGQTLTYFLELASYVSTYLNYQQGVGANEAFIHSARLPKNVYAHAKKLGYLPKRPTGATGEMTVRVPGLTFESDGVTPVLGSDYTAWVAEYSPKTTEDIVIPLYTKITSQPGSLAFVLMEEVTIRYNSTLACWLSVKVIQEDDGTTTLQWDSDDTPNLYASKQGVWNNQILASSGEASQSIFINNLDIDDAVGSLSVVTINPATTTEDPRWRQLETLLDLDTFYLTDKIVQSVSLLEDERIFILAKEDNGFRITFGDGVLGYNPTSTEIISISFMTTDGVTGNSQTSLVFTGSIQYAKDDSGVTITSSMSLSDFVTTLDTELYPDGTISGSAEEDVETTRYVASLWRNVGAGIVTPTDLQAWTLKQAYVPIANALSLDGAAMRPPQVGALVCIASKSFDFGTYNKAFLTGAEKRTLSEQAARVGTGAIDIVWADPDVVRVSLDVEAFYDPITTTADRVRATVRGQTDAFYEAITGFYNTFKPSQLSANITGTVDVDSVTLRSKFDFLKRLQYGAALAPWRCDIGQAIVPGSITNVADFWFEDLSGDQDLVYNHKFFVREAEVTVKIDGVMTAQSRTYEYSITDESNGDGTGDIIMAEVTYADDVLVGSRTKVVGTVNYVTGSIDMDLTTITTTGQRFRAIEDASYMETAADIFFRPANETLVPFFFPAFAFQLTKENFRTSSKVILGKGLVTVKATAGV
jgi:hypothetical protein